MFAVSLFSGCSNDNNSFIKKSYETDNENFTSICINASDRQIEVTPSTDEQIHIDYYENDKEFYNISVSDDHVLTMTTETSKSLTDYIGGKTEENYRIISIQVPDNTLETLDISTTNEDITISPIFLLKDIKLDSNGGNINFEKINAGNEIALNAKNGNISGSITGGYDDFAISCKIKKDHCNLPANK